MIMDTFLIFKKSRFFNKKIQKIFKKSTVSTVSTLDRQSKAYQKGFYAIFQ